jgi:pilus assembly protein CpaB
MNPPRLRLARLTAPSQAEHAGNGNGTVPKVRLREPAGKPPSAAGPAARRLLRPLPAAGIVLCLLALIGYWGVYAASTKRTPVLVATHALPAGTVLDASDLRAGSLAGEASVLAALVPAGERSQVVGQRLAAAVPAGAPLPAGVLAGRQAATAALVLDAPEFDAMQLQSGDRVSVLATFGAGSGQASTRAVARDLEVLSIGEAPGNSDPATTTVPVTVALGEPGIASQLALANEDAKLDLLIEGPGASTAAIGQATQGATP